MIGGKEGEGAAARTILERLPAAPGCVLTFDALHAAKETLELAVGKGFDAVVQVKDNAPALAAALETCLGRDPAANRRAETVDKGHGRVETRRIEIAPASPVDTAWPHTFAACGVFRRREILRDGRVVDVQEETSLYVCTFAWTTHSPERVLGFVRGHWGIENRLHHRKDRSLDEDRNRASARGCGRVMCTLRSLAATVLDRARETLRELHCRFIAKPRLVLGLLAARSLDEWHRACRPFERR